MSRILHRRLPLSSDVGGHHGPPAEIKYMIEGADARHEMTRELCDDEETVRIYIRDADLAGRGLVTTLFGLAHRGHTTSNLADSQVPTVAYERIRNPIADRPLGG
jgi:hypothetical protein